MTHYNEGLWPFVILGLFILLIYLIGMVAIVQFKGDTSIANFTWGGGVLFVAWYSFFVMSIFLMTKHIPARPILITSLITLWAGRLILYVYLRYNGKDPRFANWKWQGVKAFIINCAWIFGQAIMIAIMSYPVLLVNNSTEAGLNYLDYIGLLIWVIGYYFEAVSDYQLFKFTHNPINKGHVMRYGLWQYSRHPNYFGEVTMWWGIFLIALSLPYGWSAIIAPLAITFLLLFVTGIPWVEKAMENNPEYQEYKKRTSIFIPWLPKK